MIHLAAQPGVRHSLTNPGAYIVNNLVAFGHVVEGCRHAHVGHLVYASSSSVYGASHALPFSEDQNVDHPVSLYAATKRANELIAHSYSHLYRLPATGLRFFTVYGPWGRPDMAPMLFAKAILAGEPIRVFNDGQMRRDFTYIDDIVEGVVRVLDRPPRPTLTARLTRSTTSAITNPVGLETFITTLERAVGTQRDHANTSRCRRATFRRRMRRSTGFVRADRVCAVDAARRRVSRGSSSGIATTITRNQSAGQAASVAFRHLRKIHAAPNWCSLAWPGPF